MIRWLINHLDWQKSDNQLIIMNDLLVPASLTWGFAAFRLFYIIVNWILLDFTMRIEQSKTSEYMCLGFRKVKSYTFTALLLNQCFFVCFFSQVKILSAFQDALTSGCNNHPLNSHDPQYTVSFLGRNTIILDIQQ